MKFYDYVVNCIFSKIIKIFFLGQLPLTVVSGIGPTLVCRN